ncbi:MAG TPA: MlaD family protein, partial [Spongiibacteraceae bacterium]|nr:MlaD family protein [Spongiibacteraceae bacterium]
ALIGGWLAVKSILEAGPMITLTFKNAEGLEAGKTHIKFKDVDIGTVETIALSEDLSQVIVTAKLIKSSEKHLVEGTRFWVVRPRISGGNITGVGTLLSGAYIAVDVGNSRKPQREFIGLETPPPISMEAKGRQILLHSDNLGSLNIGAPIYFRQLKAGQVVGYDLDPDGMGITFKIFVEAPYDKYVNRNTRFWNASGIDIRLDSNGFQVNTQSLLSILLGGIAFETPPGVDLVAEADNSADFNLFEDRTAALKNPEREAYKFDLVFDESARGLTAGAPVDLRGVVVGDVSSKRLDFEPSTHKIIVVVSINLYPERINLRTREKAMKNPGRPSYAERKNFLDGLVASGLRAQLRMGNPLTGQSFVALDFFRNAKPATINWQPDTPQLPTEVGALDSLQAALTSVAKKIEKFPIEQIGNNLEQMLASGNRLMQRLDSETAPEAQATLQAARKALDELGQTLSNDSQFKQDTSAMMRELTRAAQQLRLLSDYLERHPEALLRGKPEDAK